MWGGLFLRPLSSIEVIRFLYRSGPFCKVGLETVRTPSLCVFHLWYLGSLLIILVLPFFPVYDKKPWVVTVSVGPKTGCPSSPMVSESVGLTVELVSS